MNETRKDRSPSRQARHAEARVARGLCARCGEKRGRSVRHCDDCLLKRRKIQQVHGHHKPYVALSRRGGRPPFVQPGKKREEKP